MQRTAVDACASNNVNIFGASAMTFEVVTVLEESMKSIGGPLDLPAMGRLYGGGPRRLRPSAPAALPRTRP
jgi:hypothetical protein